MVTLVKENPLVAEVEALEKCRRVMELICEKCIKQQDMNEVLAMKMHYISCVLGKCASFLKDREDKLDGLIKSLLKGRDGDGFPRYQEKFLPECIRKFPYCDATLLQQLVRSIAPVEIGNDPTALSVLTQAITGQVGFMDAEFCTSCGEKGAEKRCSVCKMIWTETYTSFYFSQGRVLCPHRYAFVNKTKTWDEAQSYCREKYLDLATIDDMSEMIRVLKALENEGAVSVWIGLKSGTDLSSHWSLADKDFYKEGERNYFNWSSTILGNCASFQKGKLHTEDCLAKQYPICFDGNKHGREQYVLIKLNMSWPGARDYCRTHHTDLTSVRNEEENQKIQEVAGDLTVWVGLFTDTFKWSDQSNSSFRYWTAGDMFGDGGGGCVALSIVHSGRWEKQPCHWLRRVFCNCPVVSFVKVRISAQDLDLNGPAVQEHILKQIKQKLSNNNVTHGSLRWKKQPDGTVLTKEPN